MTYEEVFNTKLKPVSYVVVSICGLNKSIMMIEE